MTVAIKCVWCDKPLLDVEHAKQHVAEKCTGAPWRGALAEASRLLHHMRGDYCARTCPADGPHELTCADVRAWLAAHPFVAPPKEP